MFPSSVRSRCLALALIALSACQATERLAPVDSPTAPPPAVKPYAFFLNFDLVNGTVTVQEPRRDSAQSRGVTANSLTGAEIVGVTVANMTRSATGQFVANKRTVNFDLTLSNKLSTADLVTPTFPILPTGVHGILAFPYTVAVSGTQGGKATADSSWNGDGTSGSGAPINFFNDFDDCTNGANADCYRWVMFPSPLTPGHSTPARRVGFTVDKNVTSVSIYLVVAADLADHPPVNPPGTGALLGRVFTPDDPAVGATVTVNPGARTTTIDGNGRWQFDGLAAGSYTVTLSNLPAGCPTPAPLTAVVTVGGATSLLQNLVCTAATGTITGTATSPELGPLVGYQVQLLTTAGAVVTQVTSAAGGGFTFTAVAPGDYRISATGLPARCTSGVSVPATVTAGVTTPVTLLVSCPNPTTPTTGTVSGTVGSTDTGPFAGAQIVLSTPAFSLRQQVIAGPDGSYTFTGVEPGNYVVIVANPPAVCTGNTSPVFTVTAGETTRGDYLFPCPNAAPPVSTTVLSGLVTRNGEPMDGVTITLTIGLQSYTSTTGGTGTYRFGSEIFPGGVTQVSATISASGFPDNCTAPASIPVTLHRDQGIEVPIVVTCGTGLGSIIGTASSPQFGTGFASAHVELRTAAGVVAAQTTTGMAGGYQFGQLSPGDYSVVVTGLGTPCPANSSAFPVTVQPSAQATVNVPVDCPGQVAPGNVHGVFYSATHGPLNGITVKPTIDGTDYYTTVTGGSGNFGFAAGLDWTGTQAGTLTLTLTGLPAGCGPASFSSYTIPKGGSVELVLPITCS